jgi:hypothetical protein
MAEPLGVNVGDQVYLEDGGEEIGAVRDVYEERRELLVYVENAGEFTISWDAVRATHSQKVLLDPARLDAKLKEAIQHAHDAEVF